MNCLILSSVILITVQLTSYIVLVSSTLSLEELKSAQDLIFDDISAIKRKVWIKLASRVKTLETKVETIEGKHKCVVSDHQDDTSPEVHTEDNTSPVVNTEPDYSPEVHTEPAYSPEVHTDIGPSSAIYSLLLKSFKDEKTISRRLEETVQQALNVISVLENKLKGHELLIKGLSDKLSLLDENVLAVKREARTLQKSQNDLLQDTIQLNQSCHAKIDETLNAIDEPSFVSQWILMRAQDPELVNHTVFHGLGTLPYKVDVQIQPTSGPNAGWIFTGVSAMQGDDDVNGEVYGGAVYFYDEMNVYISVPIKSNGNARGVVVNTGATNDRRLGNNQQIAEEAYIRVKIWAPSDMPEPDMKSDWLPLDVTNKSLTFYELSHGLNEYPGLVNVQIRCSSSDGQIRISEGIGASVIPWAYSNAGGVVYAYNERSVRLWTGYLSNTTGNYHHRLFGLPDGWDPAFVRNINVLKGHVRVLAWNRKTINGRGNEIEKREGNKETSEWSAFKKFSPGVDLLSFYIQADDGVNQGFRFPGYGSSQSVNSPFGGVVYAYSAKGDVRIWRPNPAVNGSLIHIQASYGNGVNIQASNNAHYVSTLIRAK